MLLTQTSQADYENLCRLNVLGLEDRPEQERYAVHAQFCEQLVRHREGWYETAPAPPPLPQVVIWHFETNRTSSFAGVTEQQKSEGIA